MVVVTLVVGLVAWSFRGTSPEAVVDTTSTSQVEEETTTTTVAEATLPTPHAPLVNLKSPSETLVNR